MTLADYVVCLGTAINSATSTANDEHSVLSASFVNLWQTEMGNLTVVIAQKSL